ncbi:MAG: hypothetical protein ABIK85_06190, partial [Candidatus Eisenbacteria bacterium]
PGAEADRAFLALLPDGSAPTALRKRAAVALGRRRPPGSLDAVVMAAADTTAGLRGASMLSLQFFRGSTEARIALLTGLEDRDWLVRINAARSLGMIGMVEAAPFILSELEAQLHDAKLVSASGTERVYRNSYLGLLSRSAMALDPAASVATLARLVDSEAVDATVKLNALNALAGHVALSSDLLSRTVLDEHQEEIVRAVACKILASADLESARDLGEALLPNLMDEYSRAVVHSAIAEHAD